MKKILSIVLGVALTLSAIALTSSCRKDINNAESLAGTTWTGEEYGDTFTLTFPTSTEFRITEEESNWIATGVFIITGNKTSLTGSHITLTLDLGSHWIDGETNPITGVFVSESKIKFEDDDESIIFNRVLYK
jgi:hypothetical protein